jgi:hypothetical protein
MHRVNDVTSWLQWWLPAPSLSHRSRDAFSQTTLILLEFLSPDGLPGRASAGPQLVQGRSARGVAAVGSKL